MGFKIFEDWNYESILFSTLEDNIWYVIVLIYSLSSEYKIKVSLRRICFLDSEAWRNQL